MQDPRLKKVVVTRAEVSDDIQHARIFVRVIGTEADARTAMRALATAAGKIQAEVGSRMQTRYTPRLAFFIDENVDRERHMNALFEQVEKELGEPPAPDDGGQEPAGPATDPESE
jgi:ribosome-binding factor A